MDYRLLKVVGAVAGIGGIALFSVTYIFRETVLSVSTPDSYATAIDSAEHSITIEFQFE